MVDSREYHKTGNGHHRFARDWYWFIEFDWLTLCVKSNDPPCLKIAMVQERRQKHI